MRATKNNWPRAIAGLAVVLGLALSVNAFDKKAEVTVVKEETKVVATTQQWYSTDATGQFIVSMLPTPPDLNGSGCAQNNLGQYCAKLLEFDNSVNPLDLENNYISDIEQDITPVSEKGAARHKN